MNIRLWELLLIVFQCITFIYPYYAYLTCDFSIHQILEPYRKIFWVLLIVIGGNSLMAIVYFYFLHNIFVLATEFLIGIKTFVYFWETFVFGLEIFLCKLLLRIRIEKAQELFDFAPISFEKAQHKIKNTAYYVMTLVVIGYISILLAHFAK